MYDDVRLSLPDTLDREVIFKRLEKVLDPELDESILKLGFVKSIEAESDHLTIELTSSNLLVCHPTSPT